MLNSGRKKNILTLVLSENKILHETKSHNPPPPPPPPPPTPLQVKWSVPNYYDLFHYMHYMHIMLLCIIIYSER